MRSLTSAVAVSAAALLSLGCGSDAASPSAGQNARAPEATILSSSQPEVNQVDVPRTVASSQVSNVEAVETLPDPAALLISEAVGYSVAQRYVINLAYTTLIEECMHAAGIEYESPIISDPVFDKKSTQQSLDKVLFSDLARIAAYGYRWPEVEEPIRRPDVELTPAEIEVIENCNDNAALAISGQRFVFAADLRADGASDPSEATTGVLIALYEPETYPVEFAKWAECMTDAGFANRSLPDPRLPEELETPIEINVAVADSECRGSSGLRDAMIEYMQSSVRTYLESRGDELVVLDTRRAAETQSALDILAARGINPDHG